MRNFIEHFQRDEDGCWLCVAPAEIDMPSGRIQVTPGTRLKVGTPYMGIDLARLLEKNYRSENRR